MRYICTVIKIYILQAFVKTLAGIAFGPLGSMTLLLKKEKKSFWMITLSDLVKDKFCN
jgi:hypothetical protein